jgi:L-rhamnose mutarotase
MAADQRTQEWWAVTMPMQQPLASRKSDEWWAGAEEVFHLD